MGNAIKNLGIMWLCIIVVYIMLAFLYPVFTDMASAGVSGLEATSNMSNYPGAKEAVQTSPLWIWFVPGGIGFIATVVIIREPLQQAING